VEQYHCKDGEKLKDLLIELHIGNGKSLAEIADYLTVEEDKTNGQEAISVSKNTVLNWLDFFDIPSKDNTPAPVVDSIKKSSNLPENENEDELTFDPRIEGFRCTEQCPFYGMCKYREHVDGDICPISSEKRKKFVRPIKTLIADRYGDEDEVALLEHYNNLADLTGATWELLDRKMSYIKSEDVTQILNRPDPITGELKKVKVANLLNNEIQKDQGMLVKLLELLKVTPKTADDKEANEDTLANMVKLVEEAKIERDKKQQIIDGEKEKKGERKAIKTHEDFQAAMTEMEEKKAASGNVSDEEIESAMDISEMIQKNSQEE
jgi:hypothetical protein